jgi:hypothetical protein
MVGDVAVIVNEGGELTVRAMVCVLVQPRVVFVPERVYVVVTVGLAVTTEPVVALNPVDGVHE